MNWRCVSRSIKVIKLIMVAVLGLGLAVQWGCQSSGSSSRARSRFGAGPQGPILDQWGERISSTGLVGIMPMEEDIRVGDIYAFSISPDQLAVGSGSARLASVSRAAPRRSGCCEAGRAGADVGRLHARVATARPR